MMDPGGRCARTGVKAYSGLPRVYNIADARTLRSFVLQLKFCGRGASVISTKGGFFASTILCAALISGAAYAQSDPTAGSGRADLDLSRRAQSISAPRPGPVVTYGDCPFVGQGTITLTDVVADGATAISSAAVDQAVADLLRRELDLGVLCEARDRITALYAQTGRPLTRVELPEQRISGGVLRLRVIEGYFTGARVENGGAMGPSATLAADYLIALETGRPAEWNDVERALLLVRELPGAEVQLALRPAPGGPGALEAVAAFAPRRKFDIALSAQRMGSHEFGADSVSARIDANSFTPWGERTSLILSSSTSGAQQIAQLMEEVRLGSSGAILFGDLMYSRSAPEGVLEPLELEGEAILGSLGVRYPVVRSRALSADLSARFESIDQENDLGIFAGLGVPTTLFQDQLRVISAELRSVWRPVHLSGFAAGGSVEVRRGVEGFGSSRAGDPLLSRGEGRPEFTAVRAQARVRQNFWSAGSTGGPWMSANVQTQWADGPLLAYEEQQLGNYTIGRGFDPGAATGDTGVGIQLEAGWAVPVDRAAVEAFVFVDALSLRNDDVGGYAADAWSAGAGARASGGGFDLSLVYAAPQAEPFPGAGKPDPRVLVSLTRSFSVR